MSAVDNAHTSWSARVSLPTFFRAACASADAGLNEGYEEVGAILLHNVASVVAGYTDGDDDEALLAALDDVFTSGGNVVEWIGVHLPAILEHVPEQHRTALVRGMREAYEVNGI